jgi:predicted transcriptional regulator
VDSGQPSSKLDLYVVARIVVALREKGKLKRTELATVSGLSHDTLVKYLRWMEEKGFAKPDAEDNVLITAEGYQVYDRLVKWILEYVGETLSHSVFPLR